MVPNESPSSSLESRVRSLERALRRSRLLTALLVVGAIAAGWAQPQAVVAPEGVLRLRRLVIEDEKGRPRVVLGAPVATLDGRRRSDAAFGLVLLDEAGRDRLQVGQCGGPQMGGVVQPRIAASTGIMVCDLNGDERGGYGFLDNGRVVLGMDDPTGEGVMLFLAPDLGMKGLIVNESRAQRTVQRLFVGLSGDATTLELKDGSGQGRMRAIASPAEAPQLLVLDPEGQELADLVER